MKYILLCIAFILSFEPSFAQEQTPPEQDMIIFKNHSQMKGKIIEVSKQWVVIKVGNAPFSINKRKIASIYFNGEVISFLSIENERFNKKTKGKEIEGKIPGYRLVPIKDTAKRGFYNVSYATFNFRSGGEFGNDEFSFGISNTLGYQFNQFTGLGIGIGYHDNAISVSRGKIVPVFGEYRGYFSDKKVSTYYSIASGLSFGTTNSESFHNSTSPGAYFYPAIGFKSGSDESSFTVDVGVRFSKVTYFSDLRGFGGVSEIEETTLNRNFTLRVGVML